MNRKARLLAPAGAPVIAAFVAVVLAALLALTAAPRMAHALETDTTTARPTANEGAAVYGGDETRVKWDGQAAEDESLSAITLVLPEGTDFTLENAKFTSLIKDGMKETRGPKVDCEFTASGQAVTVRFAEPLEPGMYCRIEIWHVVFPVSGGDMQLTGTYELADGTIRQIDDIPVIGLTILSPTDQLARTLEQQEWVQNWNSNKFLRLFFNPPLLVSSFPVVLRGFLRALGIVLVAYPLAIPIGFLLSLLRMATSKTGRGWREVLARLARGLGSLYVNVVRGTPMFLQIYIAFFGLPLAGINIPQFLLGVIVLAMNSAAYLCEIFRAGIQSIPKGQNEASRSLGMTSVQTMLFVIIPQTVRRVLPTMTNEFILLYKDTSLLAAVGVMEVVMYAKTIVAATGSITPYIVAAFFYLVVTIPLAKIVGVLEARLAGNDGGSSRADKKAKKRSAIGANLVAPQHEVALAGTVEEEGLEEVAVSPERFSSM